MTTSREISWLSIILEADPDFHKDARLVTEYEFTAPARGDPRTHEDGKRLFKGDYKTRGPYAA